MIAFLAAGPAALMIMVALWLVSEGDTGRRVPARRPFDPGTGWSRARHAPRCHRAHPAPGRDWMIA
jgi:hypothetical protein